MTSRNLGALVGLMSRQERAFQRGLEALGQRVDQKIDTKIDGVTHRIDGLDQKFDARIDGLEQKFDAKFDAQARILEISLGAVEHRLTLLETDMTVVKQHLLGHPDAA